MRRRWCRIDSNRRRRLDMLAFLKNLAGVKMDKAAQAGIEALVRWDPKSASEAELRTMEQNLDALGREVALARQGYDREKREADAIQALSHQRMAAAEQLQQQMNSENDPTRKAAVEKSLTTLVGMLEQMTPELERAQRDMARASQQREQADRQAEAARRAAGLASQTSSLTVALKAMQDAAQKDLASADAQMSKARLLRPTRPEQDDPNIAAAMAAASGKPPVPQSLTDRLAALKALG